MHRYTVELFYSEEDEGYIAVVPELPVAQLLERGNKGD